VVARAAESGSKIDQEDLPMHIGVAGLGKMGAAIAARLKEAGEDVTVWNRSPDKAQASGFPVAPSPRHLAERSEVVISTLFDAAALEAVYHGPDGLIAAASGKLFIEMSTVRPRTQQALAAAVRQAGGAFVECPVGGTTGPARSGQLIGLAGGDDVDVDRARPILEELCRRIEHVGPAGAGASTAWHRARRQARPSLNEPSALDTRAVLFGHVKSVDEADRVHFAHREIRAHNAANRDRSSV
jgi:hypothetical protein